MAIITGQAKIAVTGTAVALSSLGLPLGMLALKALATNAAVITVGGATVNRTVDGTGNGYVLAAGDAMPIAAGDTTNLYINGTAGDVVCFVGN